ncbi:MAG: hypothetical protein M0Q95_00170 [Porticoccaceae bacterium]|nr:hypothetical protein [Porticoccaceae bacterium]
MIFSRETLINTIPAQAGIYNPSIFQGLRLRGSDENRIHQNFPRLLSCQPQMSAPLRVAAICRDLRPVGQEQPL